MATIQIKRAGKASATPMPAIGLDGEMAYARGGYTNAPAHTAGDDLIISYAGTNRVLISPTRQVEINGYQTITGRKTFGLPNLSITGGAPNNVLATDGLGNLGWAPVTLEQATQSVFGATYIAMDQHIKAGTDDLTTITPRGMRLELGADTTTLVTNAKTIVPAINEMYNLVEQLIGLVVFAGIYDAATGTGTYNGHGGIAQGSGPLPVASETNAGSYLIVVAAGPGGGVNEPPETINTRDWLLSDGEAWELLDFAQIQMIASDVGIMPDIGLGSNVHVALDHLNKAKVERSGDTMTGSLTINTVADPLFLTATGQWNVIKMNGPANVYNCIEASRNGLKRISIELGNEEVENGLDSGANFRINSFDDFGTTPRPMLLLRRYDASAAFYGPVRLAVDPVDPLDAVTKRYIDNITGGDLAGTVETDETIDGDGSPEAPLSVVAIDGGTF
jgi:hypothetical protein